VAVVVLGRIVVAATYLNVTWTSRGYMPMGGERTHGSVDHKEGLYLGPDHGPNHPR
jgi:isopenicillin N synthase-like dioxygenase